MGVSLASSGKQLPESFYSYSDLNDEKHVEVNAFYVFVAHYLYLVYDNTSPFWGGGGGGGGGGGEGDFRMKETSICKKTKN